MGHPIFRSIGNKSTSVLPSLLQPVTPLTDTTNTPRGENFTNKPWDKLENVQVSNKNEIWSKHYCGDCKDKSLTMWVYNYLLVNTTFWGFTLIQLKSCHKIILKFLVICVFTLLTTCLLHFQIRPASMTSIRWWMTCQWWTTGLSRRHAAITSWWR